MAGEDVSTNVEGAWTRLRSGGRVQRVVTVSRLEVFDVFRLAC